MEPIKKLCKLCEPNSGANSQLEDMIERTTECRLVVEGGTVLNVREITSEVDDVARRANMSCLCNEPSVESVVPQKKKPETKSGKKKLKNLLSESAPDRRIQKGQQENENVDEKKSSGWQKFIKFMNDWNKLLSAVVETDGVCQKKFKALIKPKWFHQLSPKQVSLVELLPSFLIDDDDEGCIRRTQRFTREFGMHPLPASHKIKRAMADTSSNAVLFLSGLVEVMDSSTEDQTDEDSAKSNDELASEEQNTEAPAIVDYEYSWNDRLLMSAIAYLEIPVLLQTLARRLPETVPRHFVPTETETQVCSSPKRRSSFTSPYMKPVWEREPFDWKEVRSVAAERRRHDGHILRRMACPPDIYTSVDRLTHVLSRVPQPSVELDDRDETPQKEICAVLKMVGKRMPEINACPETPPPSRASGSSNFDISGMLEEVLATLQGETEDGGKCADIPSGIVESLADLNARGLICASFPSIELHPSVQQLIKHLQGEEMNKKVKKSLLIKTDSAKRCVRQLYEEIAIPKQTKITPDSHWGHIEKLRNHALHQQRTFLDQVWKERSKASQNLWHSFNPDVIYKRSFAPTFYAYMVSGLDTVNSWPTSTKLI